MPRVSRKPRWRPGRHAALSGSRECAIAKVKDAIYAHRQCAGNGALDVVCGRAAKSACGRRLIVAMPVGFVAVTESKEEALRLPVPVISVVGRKGGSAIAAAVVNALLHLALEARP